MDDQTEYLEAAIRKMTHSLLGQHPSRNFKIYRTKFPAIFRFNGVLYQEEYNIDENVCLFVEISPECAERWLKAE